MNTIQKSDINILNVAKVIYRASVHAHPRMTTADNLQLKLLMVLVYFESS